MRTLERTRHDLAAFLRARRERVSPADVGLPSGGRRRTPGLRREEVASLAGVGLTWYTWLEQGRDIGVSAAFLDSLARVLKLDAAERRHLFLLAHERPPAEPGKTWCVVPPLVRRLMHDLAPHPAYILNLRWDVLTCNEPANQLSVSTPTLPRDATCSGCCLPIRYCMSDSSAGNNRLHKCCRAFVAISHARRRRQIFMNWWMNWNTCHRTSKRGGGSMRYTPRAARTGTDDRRQG